LEPEQALVSGRPPQDVLQAEQAAWVLLEQLNHWCHSPSLLLVEEAVV
jgi:hypothetical protein